MKSLIISLCLISATAWTCENPEAQFIGQVFNWTENQKSESTSECYYQIKFLRFNQSGICGLEISQAASYQFQDMNCSLKDGMPTSGILSKKGNFLVIEK